MKRFFIAFLMAAVAVVASCTKEVKVDPADQFVGDYQFVENYYVHWGSASYSSTLESKFRISKVSANEVQMTGAWNTIGTVHGDAVSFGVCPQSDSEGYVNYTFGTANLVGNQLFFTYVGTGSVRYNNGVSYPWESSGNVIATKVN